MICLRCGKGSLLCYRGNCDACRATVRREIKNGWTSDAIEVQAGRRLPSAVKDGRRRWCGKRGNGG